MDEEWVEIPLLEQYLVSTQGRVKNSKTGRILALQRNQSGSIYVSLQIDGKSLVRSVTRLVSDNFVPNIYTHISDLYPFNTPIHLDGDRSNNYVNNLVWRPRWWAIEYQMQFPFDKPRIDVPLIEIHSGEIFANSIEVCLRYGLIEWSHVSEPTNNGERSWFSLEFQRML